MLHIILNDEILETHESRPEGWFNEEYDASWMESELAREIVKGVDLTEYIDGDYFKSPVFGGIPARSLSTGCKALLVLLNIDDIVMSGERMGDNCLEYVLKIAEIKDIWISMHHWMPFPEPFNIMLDDLGIFVTSLNELLWYYARGVKSEFKEYPKELLG